MHLTCCNSIAAEMQKGQQVLSLCVPSITDTRALALTCLVSRRASDDVLACLQQQLPSLVGAAVVTGVLQAKQLDSWHSQTTRHAREAISKPFKWLLTSAGPAVVAAPAVAHVLLRVSPDLPKELQLQLLTTAFELGLKLSAEQLVAASRERLRGLDRWIAAAARHKPPGSPSSSGSSATFMNFIVRFSGKPTEQVRDRDPSAAAMSGRAGAARLAPCPKHKLWSSDCHATACLLQAKPPT